MARFTLTMLDVRRVQGYIFNANELKQNLGASALVEQATYDWVLKALNGLRHNVNADFSLQNDVFIENGQLEAEVIYLGGGNALILFADFPKARAFAAAYTRLLIQGAPGLDAAIAHLEDAVDMAEPGALQTAWQRMRQEVMPARKEGRTTSQPLLGFGVTAACVFTGMPAVTEDAERRLISSEALAKQADTTQSIAKQRLESSLGIENFDYPASFDDLGGERGRARYIAVVHADGNDMGRRLAAYARHTDNRELIKMIRAFSKATNDAGLASMKSLSGWVASLLRWDKQGNCGIYDRWRREDRILLRENRLPMRPIVFGGDDITIVCDGRLGLPLAAHLLQAMAEHTLPDGDPLYACAGAAIVHSHYPFARAYALASELANQAKQQARRWDNHKRVALVNWHYAASGLTLDWEDIRKREYQDGQLLARPLVVAQHHNVNTSSWRTWDVWLKQIADFRQPPWAERRSKIKELREALRLGETAVRSFTAVHGSLPIIEPLKEQTTHLDGWYGDQCVYFDALEADDLLIIPEEAVHEQVHA